MEICISQQLSHDEGLSPLKCMTTALKNDVCKTVAKEHPLQALTGESLPFSANQQTEARLDLRAKGFWNCDADVFFYVRAFRSPRRKLSLFFPTLYRMHENKKKRQDSRRALDVEHASTPHALDFTTAGAMKCEATATLTCLPVGFSKRFQILRRV